MEIAQLFDFTLLFQNFIILDMYLQRMESLTVRKHRGRIFILERLSINESSTCVKNEDLTPCFFSFLSNAWFTGKLVGPNKVERRPIFPHSIICYAHR